MENVFNPESIHTVYAHYEVVVNSCGVSYISYQSNPNTIHLVFFAVLTPGQIAGISIGIFLLCLLIICIPVIICCCCCCGICACATGASGGYNKM